MTLACPGFLANPMDGGNVGWRPFSISAEFAARKIIAAAERDRAQVQFPFAMSAIVRSLALLPIPLREAAYRRITRAA